MEHAIWKDQDDECTRDVWVCIAMVSMKREAWQRLLYLDKDANKIVESAWEFSKEDGDGFQLAKTHPPVEVVNEYARLRPDMIALAQGEAIPA